MNVKTVLSDADIVDLIDAMPWEDGSEIGSHWHESVRIIERAVLASIQPAASEAGAVPVAWQFYSDGKWWNGDDRIPNHRVNTEDAGYPVRDLFAAPPAPVEAGAVPPLTPDEARRAARNAELMNGPSDPTMPAQYAMAGALAYAAKMRPAAPPSAPAAEPVLHDVDAGLEVMGWLRENGAPHSIYSKMSACLFGDPDKPKVAPAAESAESVMSAENALRFGAEVIELFDDATMRGDHMLSSTDCAGILLALTDYVERAQPTAATADAQGDERKGIKQAFIRHFGSDKDWLDLPGSWFTEGFRAALSRQPSAPAPSDRVHDNPSDDAVRDALFEVDDFIARVNGNDRGSNPHVEVLRSALRHQIERW